MNYRKWMCGLLNRISDYESFPKLKIESLEYLSPCGLTDLEPIGMPKEIRDFYSTACYSCHLTYYLLPQGKEPVQLSPSRTPPDRITGGFRFWNPDVAWNNRAETLILLNHLAKLQFDVRAAQKILSRAWFIDCDISNFFYCLVPPLDDGFFGLYLVDRTLVHQSKSYVRIAESWDHWLRFLENNEYIGIEWISAQYWHTDNGLMPSSHLTSKLSSYYLPNQSEGK